MYLHPLDPRIIDHSSGNVSSDRSSQQRWEVEFSPRILLRRKSNHTAIEREPTGLNQRLSGLHSG
eukprot:1997539-Amphidinium_carterae.2